MTFTQSDVVNKKIAFWKCIWI